MSTRKKASSVAKREPAQVKNTERAIQTRALTFGSTNYLWMGIGCVLIILGMILMSGGSMPDVNTWDEDIIYGTRRTIIAPIVILAGLGIEIYAIFKK